VKQKQLQIRRMLFHRKGLIVLGLFMWLLASCSHNSRLTKTSPPSPLAWPKANFRFKEAQYPVLRVAYPEVAGAEFVNDDQLCLTCHQTYVETFAHNVHREQRCEDCHGPASRHVTTRGKEPGLILNFKQLKKAERSEVCLKCHEQNQCEPDATWRTSKHAHNGVACTDCHTAHYNVPPGALPVNVAAEGNRPVAKQVSYLEEAPATQLDAEAIRAASNFLGAITPQICYRCHSSMEQFERVAGPHQMMGPNGFTCDTCHNPHGNVRQETRSDLCLECHKGAPTMAWHSATHSQNGVACTDCHNPHPTTHVQETVGITHTNITRKPRLPMSVDDPNVCYSCHPKVYAQNAMPSHHPIKEGKMVCSDCHDSHGQSAGNLKEATVNQVCYRCHGEKQGPFAYEHPPVTEDCAICHAPHGSVTNNLLKQPATFLCLRCHSGHRVGPTSGAHSFAGLSDVGTNIGQQRAFYSNCTECHAQVHGSDLPSPRSAGTLLR
jgi:DmsE family decaheme c-type cytochrome